MSAVAIPNMWAGKGKTGIITPLAILRTQAGNFNQEMKGLLRADVVTTCFLDDNNIKRVRHSFYIIAPGLNGYTQELLSAIHADLGAYPVNVKSNHRNSDCYTQSDFMATLEKVSDEYTTSSEYESIIALINEKNAEFQPTT